MSTIKTTHRKRLESYEYDVALSFAEESRAFVSCVANQLKGKGLKIYYDDDERVESWGLDLRECLDNVYLNEARFCVIFISEHYKLKHWTQYEQERAKARAFFTDNNAYILPFRLDSTEILGITDTVAYLSIQTHDEKKLAEAIFDKVNKEKKYRFLLLQKLRPFFVGKLKLAITSLIIITLSVVGISTQKFSTKLIPIFDSLKRIPKMTKWHFKAVCKDGWLSQSHGPGTCSGHGGIDHYVDTAVYGSSIDQCRYQSMNAFKSKNR